MASFRLDGFQFIFSLRRPQDLSAIFFEKSSKDEVLPLFLMKVGFIQSQLDNYGKTFSLLNLKVPETKIQQKKKSNKQANKNKTNFFY